MLTGGISRDESGLQKFALWLSHRDPKTGVTSGRAGFSNAIVP